MFDYQKDWLGKSKEIILVSEFLILVQICWFLGSCDSLLLGLGQDEQKHLTVRTGEVSRGMSVAVIVGDSDMWQVTGGMQHVTHETCLWHLTWYTWHVKLDFFWIFFWIFWLLCYYLHTLRASVSPLCRIFFLMYKWLIFLDLFCEYLVKS